MRRIVILGRGAAGKSTAATVLGRRTGLPVIELDKYFWQQPGTTPTPKTEWIQKLTELTAEERWILDGDLGPYDYLPIRLAAADTVIVLDFSLARCAWRAARRSRERADFWRWLICWRRRSRPTVLSAIDRHAPIAETHILRSPRALQRLLNAKAPIDGPSESK
jgi:hypothetical protein